MRWNNSIILVEPILLEPIRKLKEGLFFGVERLRRTPPKKQFPLFYGYGLLQFSDKMGQYIKDSFTTYYYPYLIFLMPAMDLRANPTPEKIVKEGERTEEEPLYRVIIHNDDITPMDFVIHILITVFVIPNPNAMNIMYTAHLNGAAHVQTLPKTEAKRRINKAHFAARLKSFPLEFSMEPE